MAPTTNHKKRNKLSPALCQNERDLSCSDQDSKAAMPFGVIASDTPPERTCRSNSEIVESFDIKPERRSSRATRFSFPFKMSMESISPWLMRFKSRTYVLSVMFDVFSVLLAARFLDNDSI